VLNVITSAGVSYVSSWNQAALANASLKKSEVGLPVSKKSSEPIDSIMAALLPIAKAFGLQDAKALVEMAEALDTTVRTSIAERTAKDTTTTSSKKPVSKKGKEASSFSSSPSSPLPADFPPSPSHLWVATTATRLLSHCADWVLRVRPSESNTVRYALMLEILSILAHRLPSVTRTRGGNGLRVALQSLFNEYSPKSAPFNFADGLGNVEKMSNEALALADRHIVDVMWVQRLSAFSSKISKVQLDLADEDNESIQAFVRAQMQAMLTVSTGFHSFIIYYQLTFCPEHCAARVHQARPDAVRPCDAPGAVVDGGAGEPEFISGHCQTRSDPGET
jgi:hypothetical protein